jgi:hypothetical protein
VLFAADPPALTSAPFSFGTLRARDVLKWVRAVRPLDFDIVLTGDGETVSRADFVALADYLETLIEEVGSGYDAGLDPAEIAGSPVLAQYRSGPHYAGRATHIGYVYRTTRMLKAEMSGAVLANYARPASGYCQSATCTAGGAIPAAAVALTLSNGPFGVVGELTGGGQWWSSRADPLQDDETARRETRGSLLVRLAAARPRYSLALLGGLSWTIADTRGVYRVKEALAPFGGRHPINTRGIRTEITAGLDLGRRLTDRWALVVPLRVSTAVSEPQVAFGRLDRVRLYAGAGVRLRVFRSFN